MNSENLKDKARVFLFYPNSFSQEEVLQLNRAIMQTVFSVSIKADSVDKMPDIISRIRSDDCATIIVMTNNLQASQTLQDVINRIDQSQNLLIMYPKAVGSISNRTVVAKSQKQVVDACSRQAAMIISRNNGSLVFSQGSNVTGGQSNINAPLIVVNYIRSNDPDLNNSIGQLRAKYANHPYVGFNPINNLTDIKYQKNQRHMLIVPAPEAMRLASELNNFSDKKYIFPVLLSRTGQVDPSVASAYKFTASDHNILDTELSTAIQKVMASKANKMAMQGGQLAAGQMAAGQMIQSGQMISSGDMMQGGQLQGGQFIQSGQTFTQGGQSTTYSRTVQIQNGQIAQNQYRVGSQFPMGVSNQLVQNTNMMNVPTNQSMTGQSPTIGTNQSLLVIQGPPTAATTTVTTTRATSSPPVLTGSRVGNAALAAATAAALQTQNELHSRVGQMATQVIGQNQLRTSNLAGRAPLNSLVANQYYNGKMISSANQPGGVMTGASGIGRRPHSANQPIRMKSAQKVLKNQPSVRVQPIVYVLKSENPYLMEAIDQLGIVPGYHPVDNFPPRAQLAPNCIIIAPYEKRDQVLNLIGMGNNRTARVALVGQEIQPDRSFNHPQVQLVTQRIDYLRNYLKSKSIRMSDVIPNITSIGKMPLQASVAGSQVAQADNIPERSPMNTALSTIHEQRSVYSNSIESNVKPVTPPMHQSTSGQATSQLPQVNMLPTGMSAVGPIMPAGVPRIESSVHIHADGIDAPSIPRPISPLNIVAPAGPELVLNAGKPRTPVTMKSGILNPIIPSGNFQREWIVKKLPGSANFNTVSISPRAGEGTIISGYQPPIVRTPSPVHLTMPGVAPNMIGSVPAPIIAGIKTSSVAIPPIAGAIPGISVVPGVPPALPGVIPGPIHIAVPPNMVGPKIPMPMQQPYKKQWIVRRDPSANKFITYPTDSQSLIREPSPTTFPPTSQGVLIGGTLPRPIYDSPHLGPAIPPPGIVNIGQPSLQNIGMVPSQGHIEMGQFGPSIKNIASNNLMQPPIPSGGVLVGSNLSDKSFGQQGMVMRNPTNTRTMVTQPNQNVPMGIQPYSMVGIQQNLQQNARPWSGVLPNGGPIPPPRLNKNEGIEMTNATMMSGNTSQKSSDANEPRRKKKSTQWKNNEMESGLRTNGLETITEEKRLSGLQMNQDLTNSTHNPPQGLLNSQQNRNPNNAQYLEGMEAPDIQISQNMRQSGGRQAKMDQGIHQPIGSAQGMQHIPGITQGMQPNGVSQGMQPVAMFPSNQFSGHQIIPPGVQFAVPILPNQAQQFPPHLVKPHSPQQFPHPYPYNQYPAPVPFPNNQYPPQPISPQPYPNNNSSSQTFPFPPQQIPHQPNSYPASSTKTYQQANELYRPPHFNVDNIGKKIIIDYNQATPWNGPSITYKIKDQGNNPNLKFVTQQNPRGMPNSDLTMTPGEVQGILNQVGPPRQGFGGQMVQAMGLTVGQGKQDFYGFGMNPTSQQLPYENVQPVTISLSAMQNSSQTPAQAPMYSNAGFSQSHYQPEQSFQGQQPCDQTAAHQMQQVYQQHPPTLNIPYQEPAWQHASKHSTGSAPAKPLTLGDGIYEDTSNGYDDNDPYLFKQAPDFNAKGTKSPQLYKSNPSDTKTVPYDTRNSFTRDNNHIKITNNNLQGSQRISNLSQNIPNFDNQNYEMRVENGISIVSRRKTPERNRISQNSYQYGQQNAPMAMSQRMTESVNSLPRTSSLDRNNFMYSSMNPTQYRRVESVDRYHGDNRSNRSARATGVLFMVPANNDQLRQSLYQVCTSFDKLMKYEREDELDRLQYSNYGAVFVFPLNERNPPQQRATNAFNILRNINARNSQQIGIRELSELKNHTKNYHKMSDIHVMQSPVTTFSIPRSNSLVTGDYKVLLRQNLRRDVQLDAYIDPQFVNLSDLQYKLREPKNFIIIVGQSELEQVYRWKKESDRMMVLAGRNQSPPSLPVDVWTDDPQVMEDAVRRAVGSKASKIPISPGSVYGNARPRVFYSFENAEIEDAFKSESNRMQLIKYYNLQNLIAKLRQYNDDNTIVILNQKMTSHLPNLRDMARQSRFIVYGAPGYRFSYTDSDVHEAPNLTSLQRQIRTMI